MTGFSRAYNRRSSRHDGLGIVFRAARGALRAAPRTGLVKTTTDTHLTSRAYGLIVAVLWVGCLTIALLTPASWDVAWRLEIAQRLLNKAFLYRDVIELNPPLWF
jgi:hypothetical protein